MHYHSYASMLNREHATLFVEQQEHIFNEVFGASDDCEWVPAQVIYGSYLTRLEKLDEFDPHRCIKYEDNWTFIEDIHDNSHLVHKDEDVIDVELT